MSSVKYSILSTKALPPELVTEAAGHGIAVKEQMFIGIAPAVTKNTIERVNSLLHTGGVMVFTSPNAVKAVASAMKYELLFLTTSRVLMVHIPDRVIYCLQGATLQAVEEHMSNILVAGTAANSAELAQKIIKDKVDSVMFLCGNIRRNDLPDALLAHNIPVEEHVVYHTTETPSALEETFDGILFLSPSSVRSFFSANKLPGHTVCFSIGETTAEALREVTDNKVIISSSPSMAALLETAIYYFDNIN